MPFVRQEYFIGMSFIDLIISKWSVTGIIFN